MPRGLQKLAPFLVLAGIALMPRRAVPRTPDIPSAPARDRTPRDEAGEALRDRPVRSRHTHDPADLVDASRGRLADAPGEIPRKGWKDILVRTWKEYQEDQAALVAAGVTFYTLLALFPAMGAFVALYGLFADVATAQRHLQTLAVVLPPGAFDFLGEQMLRLAQAQSGDLSLAFAASLALSLWGASGAVRAMITALNIAYEETETRGFISKILTSLVFTVGLLGFAICAVAVVAIPAAIEPILGPATTRVFAWITWPLLIAGWGLALAVLYRYGPARRRAKWRWITWGSAVALALWLLASAGFSLFVSNFANFERTYGSLGVVVGFLMWIFVSAQVVLLGAELNSEIEHQTAQDTTVDPEKPLGARGAVMADTVGAPQGR